MCLVCSRFTKGISIKISITADRKKEIQLNTIMTYNFHFQLTEAANGKEALLLLHFNAIPSVTHHVLKYNPAFE